MSLPQKGLMALFPPKARLAASMLIFGTVGIFVRGIPLSSGVIAFSRGILGMGFLLLAMALGRKGPHTQKDGSLSRAGARTVALLCLSGAALGGNWILLFEAYRFTTVATATLCYYLAPVFVMLASPLLREKLTVKKAVCAFTAFVGMIFVSGILRAIPSPAELKGIFFGVGAAALYACVILMNKCIRGIPVYERTVVQLGTAAVTVLPYILLTGGISGTQLTLSAVLLLAVVGVVHTGVAYALYFGSMGELKAQTVAIFSYIDPVAAVLLSGLVLREEIGLMGLIGAVLVLGPALISELQPSRKESCLSQKKGEWTKLPGNDGGLQNEKGS